MDKPQLYPTKETNLLKGHQGSILAIEFSTDGNYCVSGGTDRSLRLWNPLKGLQIKSYTGHGWEILGIAISNDNSKIASCGGDRQIFLWDVATGKIIRRYRGHDSKVNTIKFNNKVDAKQGEDCSVLVTGSYDKTVKIWDCRSNNYEPIQIMSDAKDSITSLYVGKFEIIAASVDGYVRTYDIRKGMLTSDCIGHPITSVRISHDNNCMLLSCLDNTVKLFDKSSGELLNEYKGHKNQNFKIDSVLTNDDSHVISGSEEGLIYVWDLVDAKVVYRLKGHLREVCALAMNPNESLLLSGSADGTIRVWK